MFIFQAICHIYGYMSKCETMSHILGQHTASRSPICVQEFGINGAPCFRPQSRDVVEHLNILGGEDGWNFIFCIRIVLLGDRRIINI